MLGQSLAIFACTACTSEALDPAPRAPDGWTPGQHLASARESAPRGMLDLRGLIHAHSVYSHDACDDAPRDETTDAIDTSCFDDFRRDLCRAKHDFVMLTDHSDSFSRTEYPDTLLYRAERGDALVERAGIATASWAACDDAEPTLVLAGTESDSMPVGLEGHVADTEEARTAVYRDLSAQSFATLKAQGGVVLAQHTEDWTPAELIDLGFDGFEMYNLHANAIANAGEVLALLLLQPTPEEIPHSDLVLLAFLQEDPRYLERWGSVLARGAQRVTTIGTDCHRNTFPQMMPDGERVDSYRRMMIWMSNHLLIRPGAGKSWDDTHLKEALGAGRLYGVFEVMGYAEGFDFYAAAAGATHEMGERVALADGATLVATMPAVRELAASGPQPELTLRLLRAEEGGFSVVKESATDLEHTVTEPGAYRVEVRMKPRHLAPFLSSYGDRAEVDYVWIYSNAIHVD